MDIIIDDIIVEFDEFVNLLQNSSRLRGLEAYLILDDASKSLLSGGVEKDDI